MSYFQLVQRITVEELLACPSCQSLVSDKRTSAISNAAYHTAMYRNCNEFATICPAFVQCVRSAVGLGGQIVKLTVNPQIGWHNL